MLDALRFVQGAVAKKDFVPTLQHFHIQGGTIRGYNGMMGLCCPINLNLDVCPKALPFIKAIQTCRDTIAIHVTTVGRLAIKSGSFKAFVDCIAEPFPEMAPEGQIVPLNGELLGVMKLLSRFIAEDASRPWARGILLRNQSAFATNNVCLIEYWLGYDFPAQINIPKAAVAELLRINEEPTHLQVSDNNVTFHFSGDRWLRTQTYPTDWPDLGKIFDMPATLVPVPEGLWQGLEDLAPFADELERVFIKDGSIATSRADGGGAEVDLAGVNVPACFSLKQLRLLEGVALSIDLSSYPAPCAFRGDRIRGAIVGMRE
jgi:hypothetical protein